MHELKLMDVQKKYKDKEAVRKFNYTFTNGVYGLLGENGAGKSTLMKCLFGTYQKDEGNIFLKGKEVSFSGPKDALENGIAMVHQELNQCLEREQSIVGYWVICHKILDIMVILLRNASCDIWRH